MIDGRVIGLYCKTLNDKKHFMKVKEISTTSGIVEQLHCLLIGCVESGASVDLLTPVDEQEIRSY